MNILTVVEAAVIDEGIPAVSKGAPDLFISGNTAVVDDGSQITVVLNGVTYDAVVVADTAVADAPAADLLHAILPDGDYMLSADISLFAGARLVLRAMSAGSDILASPTLAKYNEANLLNRGLTPGITTTSELTCFAADRSANFSLAEPSATWVAHSMRNPTSKRAKMTVRNSRDRIVLPSSIVLTPRVMLGALGKLSTPQIEEAVEGLIEILDCRYGDADLETDADSEMEVEELSHQAV